MTLQADPLNLIEFSLMLFALGSQYNPLMYANMVMLLYLNVAPENRLAWLSLENYNNATPQKCRGLTED